MTRLAALFGIVTLAASAAVFSLILEHPTYFPSGLFHLWALAWAVVLPFALLAGVDTLILRKAGAESRALALWRAGLCGIAAALLLRQAQVRAPGLYFAVVPGWAAPPVFAVVPALLAALAFRRPRAAERVGAAAGVVGLLFTLRFIAGASWREPIEPGPPSPGRPIVLIVFDELGSDAMLKDGRVDPGRFPRWAALAEEGAWFSDATSNSWFTIDSMAAMLTGRRTSGLDGELVFDHLQDSHRATALMGWSGFTSWLSRRARPGDRVIHRFDPDALGLGFFGAAAYLHGALTESAFARRSWVEPSGEGLPTPDLWAYWETRDGLEAELRTLRRRLKKGRVEGRFIYWHCMIPHAPFTLGPDARPHGRAHVRFSPGAGDAERVMENYREQCRATDAILGGVIDHLKAEGIYEEVLLVVTSDHGPRTWGTLEPKGYPDVHSGQAVRIPMLMRGPGVRPGVYPRDYQNIDFVPTLYDVLGRPLPPGGFDGRSAFGADLPPREKEFWKGPTRHVLDPASGLWTRRK